MQFRHVAILSLCVCTGASAQQHEPTPPAAEQPEEIVVTGERSTRRLRVEMFESEKSAYEIFNRFNDDRRFDISCSFTEPTGSRFERQVCKPEFEIQALRGHAQDYLDGLPGRSTVPAGSMAPTRSPMEAEIARHQAALRRKMKQVAETHPEFLDALVRYSELQQQYRARTGQASE